MRTLTTSALLALLTAVATAQPPVTPPPVKAPDPAPKAAPKADPTDAAIAAALANDADVKMAKAKIQLAEAELAKARQAVTLRVLTLKGAIERHQAELRAAEVLYKRIDDQARAGVISAGELGAAREKIEVAKAVLATAETELKLLTGGGPVAVGDPTGALDHLSKYIAAADRLESRAFAEALSRYALAQAQTARAAVKGPIPDRLRAALDKPVKLGAKGERVTLEKALEAFKKDAGLDVPFRGPLNQAAVSSEGEELPVGAWLQLFEDHTTVSSGDFKMPPRRARFYVREYGVLLAAADNAPPDAPTLTEFWKQKPPAPK